MSVWNPILELSKRTQTCSARGFGLYFDLAAIMQVAAELEHHLRHRGCVLSREGGAHSIWFNPTLHKIASVLRHREIKEGTVRAICKQPEIPWP